MSLFTEAIDRLRQYNLGIYNAASNLFGLSGVGGMAANWSRHSKDVATVGEGVASLADAATASQTSAAGSAIAAGNSATAAHTSEVAAAGSASAAAGSATSAAGSATAAAGSAGAAAGSASAAASSATWADQLASAVGGTVAAVRGSWLTTIADADAGNGKVWANNATLTAATVVYIDNVDVVGTSVTAVVDRWGASTNAVKGTLRIAHRTDLTKWVEFQVTGAVINGGGYRKIPVSGGTGPGGFASGDVVGVGFSRAGDAGVTPTGDVNPTANSIVQRNSSGDVIAYGLLGAYSSLSGTNVSAVMTETDGTADSKIWNKNINNGVMTDYTANDADTVRTAWRTITRTGGVVTSIDYKIAPTVNGNPIAGGLTAVTQTGNATLVRNQSFIANSASTLTFTLPTPAAVGDRFEVVGAGTGGWKIAQNANQYINFNGKTTATGIGDGIQSTDYRDCIELICTVANTAFTVVDSQGSPQASGDAGYILSSSYWASTTPIQALKSVWSYSMGSGTGRFVGTGMSTSRTNVCALHNSTYAWTLGGSPVPSSPSGSNAIDRMAFGTEVMTTIANTTPDSYNVGAGMDFNATIGKSYRWRPWAGDMNQSWGTVSRFTWSTETAGNVSTASAPNEQRVAPVTSSGTICYTYGDEQTTATINKLIASNETSTNGWGSMDTGMSSAAGVTSSTRGYVLSGHWAGSLSTRAGALTYASETFATLGNIMTAARREPGAFNNATKAFLVGGYDGSTYQNNVQIFTFATEASAAGTAISGQTIGDYYGRASTQSGGYL
ncbi:hypothetical protein J2848_005626 [Azospirillum lipoferum]|uniref:Uncharacterized protein n=1 Tax=Azospirillum lipoferum TaxID=193 RepID=A0A5A9GF69_AZOLI|nr:MULTISPECIES: hypothetical protein [Azospirillum]KAA0593013.1 hypothetical protein FZ942_26180 [Azospirillum lipoferum]MCP1613925.1 hypothetical protein [Azospirillum lipoferum]MDW5537680.1 hypothetical protein [Azospirillum sp. NL1]